jgi:hypothetical protein
LRAGAPAFREETPMNNSLSRKLLAGAALTAALLAVSPADAIEVDLTQTLAAIPSVARGVARLCKTACLGAQRKSWLDSAVLHAAPTGSSITVVLKLRSRQTLMRGVALYDDTATVRIDADVSLADCGLENVKASSSNTIYRALLKAFAPQIKAAIRRRGRFC